MSSNPLRKTIGTINPTNQIVIGEQATGQADNSVTLGNASVDDVYMAQDSGATVHCWLTGYTNTTSYLPTYLSTSYMSNGSHTRIIGSATYFTNA